MGKFCVLLRPKVIKTLHRYAKESGYRRVAGQGENY